MTEAYDFDKLISDLDEIDRWLQSIGLTSADRIRTYRRNIKEMVEAERRGAIPELERTMQLAKAREIFWSYVEGDESARALSALRQFYRPEMKAALQRALKGPADLFLERAKSKQHRDYFFELIMGGRVAVAGYQPYFETYGDVSFDFATMRVRIECKRPLREAGLERAIQKGIEQLGVGDSEMGLIAVSLSRILVPGDPRAIPNVPAAATDAWLEQRFTEIIEPSRRFWEGGRSPKLTGVWFYAFVPFHVYPGPPFYIPTRLEKIVSTARGPKKDLQEMLVHALNCGERAQRSR
jgi:hypothetical protein